jgi:hypothetical protein|tara:strand:- start:17 stop:163 length:147 start_codon:yes stop_codon:yes gene_type:complete
MEYEIKTKGGATYNIEAENLLDLFKVLNLVYMLELGIELREFKSIKQK